MSLIKHDQLDITHLENLITKPNGEPLYGEIDVYRRLCSDCELSKLTWHFWYDLKLPISYKKQSEIQIDFLLICKEGAIILEVKGGNISIINGIYYYDYGGDNISPMVRTPFEQADDYKWAILNNHVFEKEQIFIETAVAFPHTSISKTNINSELDFSWKLWSSNEQRDPKKSITDFLLLVLQKSKSRKSYSNSSLDNEQLNLVLKKLLPTIKDKNPYTEATIQSILDWLKIDNINTLESLSRNNRIVVEGGPGTGKTTIAKAYIKKYSSLYGLYICWNKLLAKKIKKELEDVDLNNCKVFQFESYLLNKKGNIDICYDQLRNANVCDYEKYVLTISSAIRAAGDFVCYDYIIIDEAQDILDKGVEILLNDLTSVRKKGLEDGRFLLFYDLEQGYNNERRKINDHIDLITFYSTHFKLNENKRVPTNKEIVKYAKEILQTENRNQVEKILDTIKKFNHHAINVIYINSIKQGVALIRNNIINHITDPNDSLWGNNCILLIDSSLYNLKDENGETIEERFGDISDMEKITEFNITSNNKRKLPFTTILKYKGLESNHVFLLMNKVRDFDEFELFIGMTRAITSLYIIILN